MTKAPSPSRFLGPQHWTSTQRKKAQWLFLEVKASKVNTDPRGNVMVDLSGSRFHPQKTAGNRQRLPAAFFWARLTAWFQKILRCSACKHQRHRAKWQLSQSLYYQITENVVRQRHFEVSSWEIIGRKTSIHSHGRIVEKRKSAQEETSVNGWKWVSGQRCVYNFTPDGAMREYEVFSWIHKQ
ncbi:hypothetical protein Y1Q_0001481 [Alligator mississippiensis]|uniref:Uncharacterized protein n=1 Tax=Alligator mississippiensis TaxID=8496 RepID=A0A151M9M9_ALLMI|nr:hypothetical protein Y1Q_0001481 [Alligator mississippiensis]